MLKIKKLPIYPGCGPQLLIIENSVNSYIERACSLLHDRKTEQSAGTVHVPLDKCNDL